MTAKLTAKEMTTVGDYYYLREGDFIPCRVDDNRKLRNDCFTLGTLKATGALFEKEEDAIRASDAIRAFLLGNLLSLQSKRQHQQHPFEAQKEVSQVFRSLLEESLGGNDKHTQSTIACHSDLENNSQRIVLIKIFHS